MSAAMFAHTPSQQQLHQHQMQQVLHHQQRQQQHSMGPSDSMMDESTPPMPQIRISSAHRAGLVSASTTPLPQTRNPPEPYVNEFQPKTPDKGSDQYGRGRMSEGMHNLHHTPSETFGQGPFTPRGQYMDPNMQHHIVQDPAALQQQQLQQQMMQQQQMFNPLPPMMTPTHGMSMQAGGAGRGAGVPTAFDPAARMPHGRMGAGTWLQDPMHSMLEEEKERKREIKLLKNREAAREGREKKRRYQMLLEARVSILETQNRALIEELKALKFLFCKPSSVMQQSHQQLSHPANQNGHQLAVQ